MIVILKRKGIWDLINCEVISTNFPAIVVRESLDKTFKEKKQKAHLTLTLFIKDDFVDMVCENENLAKTWKTLEDAFKVKDFSIMQMISK